METEQKKAYDALFNSQGIEEEQLVISFKHHNLQESPEFKQLEVALK